MLNKYRFIVSFLFLFSFFCDKQMEAQQTGDWMYPNYIKHDNGTYVLTKAELRFNSFVGNVRFCLFLGSDDMKFTNDSVEGFGQGIKITFSKNTVYDDSWAISGVSAPNVGYKNSLKGSTINARLFGDDTIEATINSTNIKIYYKGIFKQANLRNYPSLSELEKYVRSSQDKRATHTYAQYEQLLTELSKDRYIVLPLNEMRKTVDSTKIVVGLRHDVDCHPFKALEMARMENKHGIRSTYYILATSIYYGELSKTGVRRYDCMNTIYKQIYDLGCEIGIHNDLVAVMVYCDLDPFKFNHDELDFYKSLGIPIYGSATHGSPITSETVHNKMIFSDYADTNSFVYKGKVYKIGQHSLAEYGFEYEAYHINYTNYYSESGGVWSLKGGLGEVIKTLQNLQPGKRVEILAHPVWWGK
jgi:hypothetical protein